MSFYKRLGIRRVINCWFPAVTELGACIMSPRVVEAMVEASKHYVHMSELRRKAGEVIARVTGAEAGCVCNSALQGIKLMTAACMCGPDRYRIARLPDTTGLKNEVLCQMGHVSWYLTGAGNPIEMVGAKLILFGSAAGTSRREVSLEKEFERAITDKTAATHFCISRLGHIIETVSMTLEDTVEIAHRNGVPVTVDAALHPDLRYPIEAGADIATFSGGKFVGGPSATGIICGRKDLIEACELATGTLARGAKVGKEEIAALIVALEEYEKRNWGTWASSVATREQAAQYTKYIHDKLSFPSIPNVKVTYANVTYAKDDLESTVGLFVPPFWKKYPPPPAVRLILEEELDMTGRELCDALRAGDPSIYVDYPSTHGYVDIWTVSLFEGDEKIVAERVREILTERKKASSTKN